MPPAISVAAELREQLTAAPQSGRVADPSRPSPLIGEPVDKPRASTTTDRGGSRSTVRMPDRGPAWVAGQSDSPPFGSFHRSRSPSLDGGSSSRVSCSTRSASTVKGLVSCAQRSVSGCGWPSVAVPVRWFCRWPRAATVTMAASSNADDTSNLIVGICGEVLFTRCVVRRFTSSHRQPFVQGARAH